MNSLNFRVLNALNDATSDSLTYHNLVNKLKSGSATSDAIYALKRDDFVTEIGNGSGYTRIWAITPKGVNAFKREKNLRDQAARKEAARQQDALRQAAARVDRQSKGVLLSYSEVNREGIWAARLTSNVVDQVRRIENTKPTDIFAKGIASYVFVLPSRSMMTAALTEVGVFPTKEQAFSACARILENTQMGQTYLVITKMDMVREVTLDYVQ